MTQYTVTTLRRAYSIIPVMRFSTLPSTLRHQESWWHRDILPVASTEPTFFRRYTVKLYMIILRCLQALQWLKSLRLRYCLAKKSKFILGQFTKNVQMHSFVQPLRWVEEESHEAGQRSRKAMQSKINLNTCVWFHRKRNVHMLR